MGELVALSYPTPVFANLADHAYVECGNGAIGWGCFGGNSGGSVLSAGHGSTLRAQEIADLDGRAGLKKYLVNGVCHQAANRILDPADITVDGIRGYQFSVFIFGHYGRELLWIPGLRSPFNRKLGVSGDIPACMTQFPSAMNSSTSSKSQAAPLDYNDRQYIADVRRTYQRIASDSLTPSADFDFQIKLSRIFIAHRMRVMGTRISTGKYARVMKAREDFERNRIAAEEALLAAGRYLDFCSAFEELSRGIQMEISEVLDREEYRALLNENPGEPLLLADPSIVSREYDVPRGPRPR